MSKKILVVDDEPHIVQLIGTRLEANGYKPIFAYDGTEALAQTEKESPDLIILDIRMPGGGGLTVYDNLREDERTASLPVIFITAYPSEEIKKEVLEKGAVGFISKPFNSDELLKQIRKGLGEEVAGDKGAW